MNRETYDALVASYQKWRNNYKQIDKLEGQMIDDKQLLYSSADCDLCLMFAVQIAPCVGCPIRRFTGHNGCHGTPYHEITAILHDNHHVNSGLIFVTKRLIQETKREIEFLASLIPEGGPDE